MMGCVKSVTIHCVKTTVHPPLSPGNMVMFWSVLGGVLFPGSLDNQLVLNTKSLLLPVCLNYPGG